METSEYIQSILKVLPHKPGVYQYFDSAGTIIYVGKAKSLRNRVSSYFNKNQYESGKTAVLVRRIADIKYMVVESEMDALLLENSLIKKHKPRYNIIWKDDKSYPSIVIKKEPFPRIFATRQLIKDGSEYHGPYASVKVMHTVLDLVRKLYPIRSCSLPLTKPNIEAGKFKVCLEYHLGNCKGPCEGKQSLDDYEQNVENIRKIIRGNFGEAIRELKAMMQEKAANYEFEEAHILKEKIETLENFQARSTIVNPGIHNVDVFSIATDNHSGYVNFMKINNGVIVQGYTAEVKKKMDESDEELLEYSIIEIREKLQSNSREIIVPMELDLRLPNVELTVPQRGDKKKLLDLSMRNSKHYMLDMQKQQEIIDPERHTSRLLETIKNDLHLKELPVHIECFDNSNIQGTNPVSACVVFKNAKPSKNDYRKFNVKTVQGPNDFDTMKEAVHRRYSRLVEEGESLPQLIVIDGGKGQLGAALESLDLLGLRGKIAIIGIAKRLEEIYFPGDSLPIYLDKRSETLKVIQQLRDEAHRFGLSHHRDRRSKEALRSELTEIPGVGFRTTQQLIFHFKTVKKVKEASLEELEEVVNKKLARLVFDYFSKQKDQND
ncbi:MAG: excinuclease ABC subunit UvrC [Flavobacteriales bacterium]